MQWRYESVQIYRAGIDGRVQKWVADFRDPAGGDRLTIEGFDQLLNFYGDRGWELVNVVVDAYDEPSDVGHVSRVYRAIFKIPVD